MSTTTIHIQRGTYGLSVSAGDIVKVFVDDKLVIDAWDILKKAYDADYHNECFHCIGRQTYNPDRAGTIWGLMGC